MSQLGPLWFEVAGQDIGMRELPGAPTAPKIAQWLAKLGAAWRDDETPWCGTAVAAWMKAAGADIPKHWYRARAWLDWGLKIDAPIVGCVVVFERQGGGHVGLVAGKDEAGNLMVLGGNQGDAVNIKPFSMQRVLGYRWPADVGPSPIYAELPTMLESGSLSTNEA